MFHCTNNSFLLKILDQRYLNVIRRQRVLLEFLEFQEGTGRCRCSAMNTQQQSWQRSDRLCVRIGLYRHMWADYNVTWLSLSLAWLHRPVDLLFIGNIFTFFHIFICLYFLCNKYMESSQDTFTQCAIVFY